MKGLTAVGDNDQGGNTLAQKSRKKFPIKFLVQNVKYLD